MSRRTKFFKNSKSQVTTKYAPPPGPPPDWPQWQTPGPSTGQLRPEAASTRPQKPAQLSVLSHENELKRIFKACRASKGNAQLLQESLLYTKAEEVKENSLVQEFLKKCRDAQEQIASNIPWATHHAEQSPSGQNGVETEEERLLAELLATNEQLLEALKMYDDLENQEKRDRDKAERKMRALEAITSFTPTPSESALVDRIFSIAGAQNSGSILPEAAHHILLGARLPYDTLQEIWDVANVEENATYGKYCIGIAVRLVGHVQNGAELSEELVTSAGPIATIEGLEPGRGPSAYSSVTSPRRSGPSSPPPASLSRPPMPNALSNLPPLTDQDRNKFMKIFQKSGQENNVLSGPRAREVLMKSRLPMETLGQIWDLADTESRGHLDAPAFTIAMYLVQACMSGHLTSIPPLLPQSLYDQAALSSPQAILDAHYGSPGPSPHRSFSTGPSPNFPAPAQARSVSAATEASLIDLDEEPEGIQAPMLMPVPTIGGSPLMPISMPSPGLSMAPAPSMPPGLSTPPGLSMPPPGLSTPLSPMSPTTSSIFRPSLTPPSMSRPASAPLATPEVIPEGWNWDVKPSDKASSDKFFDTLDPWKQGFIEGDAAVGFLSKSKLPPAVLGRVWDLADINHDGRLTKEEFAVAMYLIRGKLVGREIPNELPPSLIPPPNLPDLTAAPATPPQQYTVPATPVLSAEEAPRSNTPPPPYDENVTIPEETS